MLGTLQRSGLLRQHNYIAGDWQGARAGASLPVVDPATQERVATVPDSTAADALAALDAAHAAFPAWRSRTGREARIPMTPGAGRIRHRGALLSSTTSTICPGRSRRPSAIRSLRMMRAGRG